MQKTHLSFTLVLCLIMLTACDDKTPSKASGQQVSAGVLAITISDDQAAHLGIRTAPARSAAFARQLEG
jgi:hypothetical protein